MSFITVEFPAQLYLDFKTSIELKINGFLSTYLSKTTEHTNWLFTCDVCTLYNTQYKISQLKTILEAGDLI